MKRYYTLGGQRVAVRSGATLSWLFSDHLGSTSITADNNGSISGEKSYYPIDRNKRGCPKRGQPRFY
jgi:hypothetical protein